MLLTAIGRMLCVTVSQQRALWGDRPGGVMSSPHSKVSTEKLKRCCSFGSDPLPPRRRRRRVDQHRDRRRPGSGESGAGSADRFRHRRPGAANQNSLSGAGTPTPVDTGSLDAVTTLVGAKASWKAGYKGQGVDVALIDTGVTPSLDCPPATWSTDPTCPSTRGSGSLTRLDGFGHGTHLAGIIAGRDVPATAQSRAAGTSFTGVAPASRVISMKVGAYDGSADVSQVIAALDWVAQHAHDPGLNIRVINLSFGTDSSQAYTSDPLAFAVENAWRKGIVVVVAAGNDGTSQHHADQPRHRPVRAGGRGGRPRRHHDSDRRHRAGICLARHRRPARRPRRSGHAHREPSRSRFGGGHRISGGARR